VIGHYAHTGVWNAIDLGKYHCCFLLISWYLVRKNCLSTQEQSCFFFKGLPTQLEGQVQQQLQQKFINHFSDDPYELTDVYDMVRYILMGSASMGLAQQQQAAILIAITSAPD
jgi:hypothetical protein